MGDNTCDTYQPISMTQPSRHSSYDSRQKPTYEENLLAESHRSVLEPAWNGSYCWPWHTSLFRESTEKTARGHKRLLARKTCGLDGYPHPSYRQRSYHTRTWTILGKKSRRNPSSNRKMRPWTKWELVKRKPGLLTMTVK